MTDFLTEMDALAAEIAEKARGADTKLDTKIDAFKALVPYYVQKMKKKGDDPGDDPDTFESFQNKIMKSEHDDGEGKPGVRNSGRNGSASPAA